MADTVNLAAEFAPPETVAPAPAVNLTDEFDAPPRQEQHAVINDAADKARKFKAAFASGDIEQDTMKGQTLLEQWVGKGRFEIHRLSEAFSEDPGMAGLTAPTVELPLAKEGAEIPIPSPVGVAHVRMPILTGAYNGLAPIASSLTSPLNIATLGTMGALVKVAQNVGRAGQAARVALRIIQTGFAAEMAKGAGEAAGAASVPDGKSVQAETADVVGALAQGAMAALATHGAMKGSPPPGESAKTPTEAPPAEPSPPVEPVNTESVVVPERAEYDALSKELHGMVEKSGTPEYNAIQQRIEDIKNRNKGMPPGEVAAEPVMLEEEFTPPAKGTEEHAVLAEELAKVPEEPPAPPETPIENHTPPEGGVTGVRNAIVDQERKDRGLPPAMEPAAKEFGDSWTAALKEVEKNPNAGADLVADVIEKPRPLTDTENALLLHRQIEVQNQFDKLTQRITDGDENASPEQRAADSAQLAKVSDDLLEIYNAGKLVGTEQGRGLASRKMLANEDFSLAKMTTLRRAVNDGKPLTAEQSAEVKELHAKIEATQKAFDEYRVAQEERIRGLEKKRSGTTNTDKNVISRYIDKQADAARERIKARYAEGRVQAGLDPADLADHALVGAQHIKNGVAEFGAWSAEMVREFGERVKPFLQQIFEKAQEGSESNALVVKLEARKKALEARIKELEKKVNEGDTSVTPPKASRPSVEEIETLEQRRDELSEELGRMREVESKVDELKAAIEENNRKIAEGDLSAKPSTASRPSLPAVEKLKQERDALNKELEAARKQDRKPTDAETAQRKLDAIKEQIAEKKEAIRTGKLAPERDELNRPQPKELEEALREREELTKQIAEMRPPPEPVHGNEPMTPEERRLSAFKSRSETSAKKYNERTATGDFGPREKPPSLVLDEEAQRLKAANERAKIDFQTALIKDRLATRSSFEKAQDTFVRWRRGFLLSGPSTLAKLTGAAFLRVVTTPVEELAGAAIGKVAPELMAKAPRHGGLNTDAEAKALTAIFTKGMKDAYSVLTTGKSTGDILFGRTPGGNVRPSDVIPQSMIDFFGNLHGALKAPVKASEFARSMEKRMAYAIRNGVDVSDPAVQQAVSVAAYKDANRAIFLQDNRVADKFTNWVNSWENEKGKPSPSGKIVATTMRMLLPIVKVPSNIVAEAVEYATGSITGNLKLAKAMRDGMDNLTPEQADVIARQLKKGYIGFAALAIGYFGHKNLGGFFQQGEKRDKKDVAPGAARIGNTDIGRSLIHSSLVETMQLGATIGRVQEMKIKGQQNSLMDSVGLATLGLAEELPFVRTPIEIGKLFDKNERPYVKGELVKGLVVPQLVSQAAQFLDTDAKGNPIRRDPKTVLQHVETGIPGLRETVRKK